MGSTRAPPPPPLRAARRAIVLANAPAGLALRTGERPREVGQAAGRRRHRERSPARPHRRRRARRADAPAASSRSAATSCRCPAPRTVILDDITVAQVAGTAAGSSRRACPPGSARRRVAQQRLAHRRARGLVRGLRVGGGVAARRLRHRPAPRSMSSASGRRRSPHAGERDWSIPRLLWIGLDWERKGGDARPARVPRAARRASASRAAPRRHPPARWTKPGVTAHGRLDRAARRSARGSSRCSREATALVAAVHAGAVRDRLRRGRAGRRRRASGPRSAARRPRSAPAGSSSTPGEHAQLAGAPCGASRNPSRRPRSARGARATPRNSPGARSPSGSSGRSTPRWPTRAATPASCGT